MTKFSVRYGRTVRLADYQSARIEIEEEFDSQNIEKQDALYLVARMVEGYAQARLKYPDLFFRVRNNELENTTPTRPRHPAAAPLATRS